MPFLIEQAMQPNGYMGYTYELSPGETTESAGELLIANADVPFTFLGKVGDRKNDVTPKWIAPTLSKNNNTGEVAAIASINGMRCIIKFIDADHFRIEFSGVSDAQADADQLAGASYAPAPGMDSTPFDDFNDMSMGYDAPDDFADAPIMDGEMPIYPTDDFADDGLGGIEFDPADMSAYNELVDNPNLSPFPPAGGAAEIKTGEWLLTLILLAVPIVNLVVLIMWLVSKKTNPTKKNFLKAYVVMLVIGILLSCAATVATISLGLFSLAPSTDTSTTPSDTNSALIADFDSNAENGGTLIGDGDETNEENAGGALGEGGTNANGDIPAVVDTETVNNDSENLRIDAVTKTQDLSGNDIAIVTMTVKNTSKEDKTPQALVNPTARQGDNTVLERTFNGQDGYAPGKWTEKLSPGAAGTFQIAYILQGDEPFHLVVNSKDTGEQWAEHIEAL